MDNNIEQSINTENKPELAEVFSRIAANIVDSIILFFVALMIAIPAIYFKIGWLFIVAWIVFIVEPLYFVPFEMRSGQTPGKKFVSIKVVDREYREIGFLKALVRNITKVIPLWKIIGVLLIALTEKRQRLGDMLAGTLVIKVK